MRFINHAGVSRISTMLHELDVGDRLLCGHLELFSTRKSSKQLKEGAISAEEFADGPSRTFSDEDCFPARTNTSALTREHYGSFDEPSIKDNFPPTFPTESDAEQENCSHATRKRNDKKQLLPLLVTAMNVCFPHYDFSAIDSSAFVQVDDFVSVYTAINYHLSFLAEVVIPGFIQDLWSVIQDVIDLKESLIFSYNILSGQDNTDPYVDEEGCLFGFDYFFVDSKQQRVLFFSCITKQKPMPSPSNASMQDLSSAASISSQATSIQATKIIQHSNSSESYVDEEMRSLEENEIQAAQSLQEYDDEFFLQEEVVQSDEDDFFKVLETGSSNVDFYPFWGIQNVN